MTYVDKAAREWADLMVDELAEAEPTNDWFAMAGGAYKHVRALLAENKRLTDECFEHQQRAGREGRLDMRERAVALARVRYLDENWSVAERDAAGYLMDAIFGLPVEGE